MIVLCLIHDVIMWIRSAHETVMALEVNELLCLCLAKIETVMALEVKWNVVLMSCKDCIYILWRNLGLMLQADLAWIIWSTHVLLLKNLKHRVIKSSPPWIKNHVSANNLVQESLGLGCENHCPVDIPYWVTCFYRGLEWDWIAYMICVNLRKFWISWQLASSIELPVYLL
jgi:hypothetical protein